MKETSAVTRSNGSRPGGELEVAHVGALERLDPRIGAQLLVELARGPTSSANTLAAPR